MTALPTAIAFLSFFAMNKITLHILKVRLLVLSQTVILEPIKVLAGGTRCDKMWNERWVGIDTASLNSIFLCIVDFVLASLALLT